MIEISSSKIYRSIDHLKSINLNHKKSIDFR